MKIVDFTQGNASPEWLEWRKDGIGASEISILLGSNPYKTPMWLWEQKCGFGEEETVNAAMQHGIRNEPVARDWLNEQLGLDLKPICIEDHLVSYRRASLDGYDSETKTICEIKCPVNERVIEDARTMQRIPDHWFHQMQWQIMLAQPERAIFAIWDYRNKVCIKVEMFGETKLHEKMKIASEEFWHRVRIGKAPELQDSDFAKVEVPDVLPMLEEFSSLGEKIKSLTKEKNELKNKIIPFGDGGSFKAFGYKVRKVSGRSSYNIEQMRIDGIDVDTYTKRGKESFLITAPRK